MTRNDPFATHPEVPSFTVTSTTLADGDTSGRPDVRHLRRAGRQGPLAQLLVRRA